MPSLNSRASSLVECHASETTRPPPRIALVVASLEILGGHGTQASALREGLQREGYAVSLVAINPAFPRGLRWLRRFPYLRTLLNQALYLPSLTTLRHADVVHVYCASYWSFLLAPAPAMLMARLFGKRVVLNYHSGEADDHLARWGRLVHPCLRSADALIVPSAYLQRVFERHGHEADVIPNVIDPAAFRFRARRPLTPRLVSTRNLEPYYDVANTIRAFAQVERRLPGATLTVAGVGGEERALRDLAADLGTRGVRFVGRVEPRDMPALCDAADVFVNSSVLDNQPVSVLEAQAAGLAVVSTPTGGIADLVRDGETGRLVPARDPAAMAQAVVALIEAPERAADMAARARAAVEADHTWPGVRARWAAAYGAAA